MSFAAFNFFFFRISSYHNINSVCWSHALFNDPTSKSPSSDDGVCSWAAVDDVVRCLFWLTTLTCCTVRQSHFFVDALYRQTPVPRLFRVVQCFRLSSSPLAPYPGSDTWRYTRVGPDAIHSFFHAAAIHASFDLSSGMTLRIS